MAVHFEIPTLIKIREGIRVNLGLTVTHAVEPKKPQLTLKADVRKAIEEGKRTQQSVGKDDYDKTGEADTVSFWFIGGTSVQYVAGKEITQEDFDKIKRQLDSLEFREKSDGKPSNN